MSGLLDMICEEDLRVVFQPILRLDPEASGPVLVGFECLVRGPRGTNLESPDVLFGYVRRKQAEAPVDRICIRRILSVASVVPPPFRLSVNVHAATLGADPGFGRFLLDEAARTGLLPSRLTVEVIEHAPAWSGRRFLEALDELDAAGVTIALDDVGQGQANFRMILDARPHVLKIDRYLVQACDGDAHRRGVLASIGSLARRMGVGLVAEGIERSEELDCLMALGIPMGQGYLLGMPVDADGVRLVLERSRAAGPGAASPGASLQTNRSVLERAAVETQGT